MLPGRGQGESAEAMRLGGPDIYVYLMYPVGAGHTLRFTGLLLIWPACTGKQVQVRGMSQEVRSRAHQKRISLLACW